MTSRKSILPLLFLSLLIILTTTGCGAGKTPEWVARRWMTNITKYAREDVLDDTCAAKQEEVTAVLDNYEETIISNGLDVDTFKAKTDISTVEFEVLSQTEDTTTLSVTGIYVTTINNNPNTTEMDEVWKMVMEDGAWHWCGDAEISQ